MNLATMRVPANVHKVCALGVAYLCGLILVGCATTQTNPWDDIELDEAPVEAPLTLPELPKPTIVGDTVVLDANQAAQVRSYGIIARTNTTMADEYSKAINERKRANTALVEAGKAQRVQTSLLREQIQDERRHNFFTSIGYWVVIVALGFAL